MFSSHFFGPLSNEIMEAQKHERKIGTVKMEKSGSDKMDRKEKELGKGMV